METGCDHYFLTATARRIWRENDVAGEAKMYKCLLTKQEEFFARVIFKNGRIHEDVLRVLAETAWVEAWMELRGKAQADQLVINSLEYTGYFYMVFKYKYLKLLEKAEREDKAKHNIPPPVPHDPTKNDMGDFERKRKLVLNMMGKVCRELLTWYFEEGLTHDEMVVLKNGEIKRENMIKMLSRCKIDFLKKFKELK